MACLLRKKCRIDTADLDRSVAVPLLPIICSSAFIVVLVLYRVLLMLLKWLLKLIWKVIALGNNVSLQNRIKYIMGIHFMLQIL